MLRVAGTCVEARHWCWASSFIAALCFGMGPSLNLELADQSSAAPCRAYAMLPPHSPRATEPTTPAPGGIPTQIHYEPKGTFLLPSRWSSVFCHVTGSWLPHHSHLHHWQECRLTFGTCETSARLSAFLFYRHFHRSFICALWSSV